MNPVLPVGRRAGQERKCGVNKVWINRKLVDIDKAKVSVFDRGFMYGDGVFETMRSYAGTVFGLDAHLARLFRSLEAAGFESPYSKTRLEREIYRTLKANGLKSAYIRLTMTRGEGRFGIEYKDEFTPNVVIVAREFGLYPGWMFRKGLSAGVVGIRQNERSPLSGIKSLNFLPYILARLEAKKKGFDEAILANTRGDIAEAATSNIFIVRGSALLTPSLECGIRPGVTRAVVLKIARRLGIAASERTLAPKQLLGADEVFLTNSLAEVLPVTRIDGARIGRGIPGDVTKLLHISYQKEVIREVLR